MTKQVANITTHDPRVLEAIAKAMDVDFYIKQITDGPVDKSIAALHYVEKGVARNLDPHPDFSTSFYLDNYRDVAEAKLNPFYHYIIQGKSEGRLGKAETRNNNEASFAKKQSARESERSHRNSAVYELLKAAVDSEFYLKNNPSLSPDTDVVHHYIVEGAKAGLDPSPAFSTSYYLKTHKDVKAAGVNPFYHYLTQGKNESRSIKKSKLSESKAEQSSIASFFKEHAKSTEPSPLFEEANPTIGDGRTAQVKALAFYLPQFHEIPENNEWWGTGFTEWRNTARGIPRYVGHRQPRIPRDLGFYDLSDPTNIHKQITLARLAGIYGFCFYYYSFNGRRILDRPVEAFLQSETHSFPFMLIWANENWTKTWDGLERSVLLSQDYKDDDEDTFLDDLARHFQDRRYIRVRDRPLFVIYRPGLVPEARTRFRRWRAKLRARFGLRPLLFMAQGFGDEDPGLYGLDGAMEFPPHKVAAGLPPVNGQLTILDDDYSGNVLSYEEMVKKSIDEPVPTFPLIKGVTLDWDNEARRPSRGMSFQGATPSAYERWLREICRFAKRNPILGERFAVINAWNEWAEGTYLEPDTHYGAAYLNATARAVFNAPPQNNHTKRRVLLVGHDAYRHGAQILLLNIGRTLTRQFGISIRYIILGQGPLLADYGAIGPCRSVPRDKPDEIEAALLDARRAGFDAAIVNTAASGIAAEALHEAGISFVSLIHELPKLIREYGLESECSDLAKYARYTVFPAEVVLDGFRSVVKTFNSRPIIRPQGLYNRDTQRLTRSKQEARTALRLPISAQVILNVGYADHRKGFDIFVETARRVCKADPSAHFVWVGDTTQDMKTWVLPELYNSDLTNRFHFVGHVHNVDDYYAAADIFFLSSREDPFPSVVLEALSAGLPIVGFDNTGGCKELINTHGILVSGRSPDSAASAILDLLKTESGATEARLARQRVVAAEFSFDDYCFNLCTLLDSKLQKVSVVVPNYNYASCLADRLSTIRNQSYPIFELIILDDKSSDNSLEVITSWSLDNATDLHVIANETNSGNVFRQWTRGLELARGDIIWIAEADDLAAPLFLERLINSMSDPRVGISFSDSWQLDASGERIGESYKAYLSEHGSDRFERSFKLEGSRFAAECLSIKNSILNVSSVVWRKEALASALVKVGDALYDYAVAGDWMLYATVSLEGWSVSYTADPLNGHRRHESSVTKSLNKQRHFNEIEAIQSHVANSITLSPEQASHAADYRIAVRKYLGLI